MIDRLRFFYNRLCERLWIKPLLICLLSIASVFLAKFANGSEIYKFVPEVTLESIESLLNILSSSMLVIATFAVASMVAAYASASSVATPRSFSLVIADDVSQNALSRFIGTFIFSIVALITAKNEYFDKSGLIVLFALTVVAFILVITTFVHWVDRIARLGRLGSTIDKVESATKKAIQRRGNSPTLGALSLGSFPGGGIAVYSDLVGYVQRVDVEALQTFAKKSKARISVASLPGTFAAPGVVLAYVISDLNITEGLLTSEVVKAFIVGDDRKFDEDPRFGLVVLSEIAGRALSPAVNDPGTAIDIVGTYVRLFSNWCTTCEEASQKKAKFDLVEVPEISVEDMFDDAFTAIARDGAGSVEVAVRLQKAFYSLASIGNNDIRKSAIRHSGLAFARTKLKMELPKDLEVITNIVEEIKHEFTS